MLLGLWLGLGANRFIFSTENEDFNECVISRDIS